MTDHDIGTLRRGVPEHAALLGAHAVTPTWVLPSQCVGKLRIDDALCGPGYGRYLVRLLICRKVSVSLAGGQVIVFSRTQSGMEMARRRQCRFR